MNHISEISEPDAIRELDRLRKEIKNSFRCDDWQNIAQRSFIKEIFKHEISSKDRWLSNTIIQSRYKKYEYQMKPQIDSEIGKKYFNILERITWDSIL